MTPKSRSQMPPRERGSTRPLACDVEVAGQSAPLSQPTEGALGNAVTAWFGDGFAQLHPLLQALHREPGRLSGPATLQFGIGLAGMLGRRLARGLGIPDVAGPHHLDVDIGHDASTLWWHRCFDHTFPLRSIFRPHGHWPHGHWIETTGPLEVRLTVDVIDGGWYWRVTRVRLHGLRVPLWLLPKATAYKRIEAGQYRFHVGFSLPLLGQVFCYSGLLQPVVLDSA